jgi:NNP family nitrate/nitrite transporter-like MFS transporter
MTATHRTRRWIDDWRPEDTEFWETTGAPIARRNLIWSIFAEHLGFSIWLLWSVTTPLLITQNPAFNFTFSQLFLLTSLPNLIGSLLRLPYTFAVPKFGGRNWTIVSALLLLIPTIAFMIAVTHSGTPFWAFAVISCLAGLGGGNFASSMANINFFYPASKKGAALGLNAAGGNLGVATIQFFLPAVVGSAAIFGLVSQNKVNGKPIIHLEYAGYIYVALAIVAGIGAYFFMDNLTVAKSSVKEQVAIVKNKHTWVMAFLYIGTFGSFIGYSSAMPLLIKLNFASQPLLDKNPIGIVPFGINFAFYAFIGGMVGSLTRPLGGMLADKIGGAKVTLGAFVGIILGTLGVLWSLTSLSKVPALDTPSLKALKGLVANSKLPVTNPLHIPTPKWPDVLGTPAAAGWHTKTGAPVSEKTVAAINTAVHHNEHIFVWFLLAFVFLFAMTGIGNGSAYKMIPSLFRRDAELATTPGTEERKSALLTSAKQASAALGVIGAVGAFGGFLVPLLFGAPWVANPTDATKQAFWIFTGFYIVCALVTLVVYVLPKRSPVHVAVLSESTI